MRIAAVQQILPHLTSDNDASKARPDLDQAAVSSLPNLFCLRNPLDITLDTSNKFVLKVKIHTHTWIHICTGSHEGIINVFTGG